MSLIRFVFPAAVAGTVATALSLAWADEQGDTATIDKAPTTAEEQKAAKPQEILDELMAGNKRYVAGQLTERDWTAQIEASASGQYPKAVILSCLDSRVPVEQVFDQGIGDIFVGRVAGNIVNEDQLGSMEFATQAAGSKVILVLGHTACGAVKGAADGVEMGNLTALLNKIEPAVEEASANFEEDQRTSKNADFVNAIVKENVKLTVAEIRKQSPILAEAADKGEILIAAGVYNLEDGSVTLLDLE